MNNKLLTTEDLFQYCLKNNFSHFNSKEHGSVIVVQSEGLFEVDYNPTQGLVPVRLQACHTELNRNNSYISEEVMTQALPSLKNRPILGNVIELDNGEYDFHSHDMIINTDEDEIEYIEKPIGILPESCNPHLEYDEDKEKTYVVVDGLIFEDYSNKELKIIKEKETVKVSVELCIEEMSFNAKEKYLSIDKFYFNGVTCLGREKNGTEIGEGMLGSNLTTIDSFSQTQNSILTNNTEKTLLTIISEFSNTLDNFNKKFNLETMEGGEKMEDNIKTEDTGLQEAIASEDENLLDGLEGEAAESESEVIGTENEAGQSEDETDEENSIDETEKKKECSLEDYTLTYQISHEDIRCGLYKLLEVYEEVEKIYYWISDVFDNYFIYQGYSDNGEVTYKQFYKTEEDVVSFEGDRVEVFAEYLTLEEKAALETMRNNYASLVEFKESIEQAELLAQKEAILSADEYSELIDNAEFKELIENIGSYSVKELDEKATYILGKEAKIKKASFASTQATQPKEKEKTFIQFGFDSDSIGKKNEFLDGLLSLKK